MKLMLVRTSRGLALVAALVVAGCSSGRQFQPHDGSADLDSGTGGGGAAGNGTGGSGGHGLATGAGGAAGASGTGGAAGAKWTGGAAGGAGATGTGGAAGAAGATGPGGAGGTTISCSSTQHECSGTCVDNDSPDHCGTLCGACTPPSGATATCTNGSCGFTCPSGQHACGSGCADDTSVQTCGTLCSPCMAPATGTATCTNGTCGYTCGGATPKNCATAMLCIAATGCCDDTDCPTTSGGQVGTCDTGTHTCNYNCPSSSTKSCTIGGTTTCIPTSGCCQNSDCSGTCVMCGSNNTCVPVTGQDDPNGRCAGTCDANGACKSKQGQICNTVAGGCISGTTCSPDGYCCDTACAGACVACDIVGYQGTCTNLATNATPHSNHPTCGGTGTCAGFCGSGGACSFPTSSCGSSPTCSGTSYVGQATCSAGSCVTPAPQTCTGNLPCSGNACKPSCAADADCLEGYYCETGTCHLAAVSVKCGDAHACALLSDGSVRCWGSGTLGQLGNGMSNATNTFQGSATPVAVMGLKAPAASIAAGGSATCALLTDGSDWCWGSNESGQLANGSDSTPTPVEIVNLGIGVTAIGLGFNHACAIESGYVYCWGRDYEGEVGSGSFTTSTTDFLGPTMAIGPTLTTIVTGGYYHTCAATPSALWCWGDNITGQLGNGQYDDPVTNKGSASPLMLSLAVTSSPIGMSDGSYFSCVLFGSGSAYCWGANDEGQLGTGTVSTSGNPYAIPTPQKVIGLSSPTAIAAGGDHACAVNGDGSLVCWGLNSSGELGQGTVNSPSPTPAPVVGLPSAVTSVSAGTYFTCAVVQNGSVWCWGALYSGFFTTPVELAGW